MIEKMAMPELMRIAAHDPLVHAYLAEWHQGERFASFESLLIALCVHLATDRQRLIEANIERAIQASPAVTIPKPKEPT